MQELAQAQQPRQRRNRDKRDQRPGLVSNFNPKFYYVKRRFPSHQNADTCME
jgi:hypothetical protein